MLVSGRLTGIAVSFLVIGLVAIPAAWAGETTAGRVTAAVSVTASVTASAATNLYVDFNDPCNDKGPGTLAEPFCTIQEAADVVNPGQTVDIMAARARQPRGDVTITRSGTPTAPITFTWAGTGINPTLSGFRQTGRAVITLKDVHDVTLSGLEIENYGTDDGVDVLGSSAISLADLSIVNVASVQTAAAGIRIDGSSSDVTVSRTRFFGPSGYAVLSSAGARQVTLTTNTVQRSSGFTLNGTTGAVVASNTVFAYCGIGTIAPSDVTLAGGSSGTVENNVLETSARGTCPAGAGLSVDAASAAGVTADYNAFLAFDKSSDYSWAGTRYATPADFAWATGQGAHDVTLTKTFIGVPPEGSAAINSANCDAPGELGTDLLGSPLVRDPLATDAGLANGTCYASRGAYARQDSLPIHYTAPPLNPAGYPAGSVPFTLGATITSATTSPWNEPVSYTVSFGDGSAPVPAAPGTAVTHQYSTVGQHTAGRR